MKPIYFTSVSEWIAYRMMAAAEKAFKSINEELAAQGKLKRDGIDEK